MDMTRLSGKAQHQRKIAHRPTDGRDGVQGKKEAESR